MSDTDSDQDRVIAAGTSPEWHWNPDLPIALSPIFAWPPHPGRLLRWMSRYWLALSSTVVELLLAIVMIALTQPSTQTMQSLGAGWIMTIWLRNLVLLCLVAGMLHLWLYRFCVQGRDLKFDTRDFAVGKGAFSFRNQVYDNMFWSLVSGVTIWTLFEASYFWAAANGAMPVTSFAQAPVWSVLWVVIIPLWALFHFYRIHRLLHWPPLYRSVHKLHHRYFECNYGTAEVPWDAVFGSFHNGTPEANKRIRARKKRQGR